MNRKVIGTLMVGLILVIGLSTVEQVDFLSWLSAGGGNLLLVLVTLAYVVLTYELVRETRRSREDEIHRHRNERLQERVNIRSALLAEIEQMRDEISVFDPDSSSGNHTVNRDITYTTIYENNTDRLGYLTQSEVTATVEAYNEAINMHRDLQKGMEQEEDRHIEGHTGMHNSRFRKLDEKLGNAQEELEKGLDSDRQEDYWLQENSISEETETS